MKDNTSSATSSVTIDSFNLLLEDCSSKEYTHEMTDILTNLIKDITPLLLIVKEEGKGLINEIGLNSLKSIVEKYNQPDINYIIASLFNKILLNEFYSVICNDEAIMINLFKLMNTVIERIRESGILSHLLIRKTHLYLTYLIKHVSSSTKPMIIDLIKSHPIYHSNTFKHFNDLLQQRNVMDLFNSIDLKDKEKGVSILIDLISNDDVLFPEQFEVFYLSTPCIISSLLKDPKENAIPSYLKYANILCRMLYYPKYKLILTENDEDSSKDESKTIFILNDQKTTELSDMMFLDEKIYELSYHKELLELNENNIGEVCLLFINLFISSFNHIFQMQFMIYLILKRLYFIFPSYRKDIEEYIPIVLSNLCKFQSQKEWNTSLECRQFAYYLLTHDSILKSKIKSSTVVNKNDMRYEALSLRDVNLMIGYPFMLELKAGEIKEKIIEIEDHKTIVYISIDEVEDRELEISLLKYNSELKTYEAIIEKEEINGDGKIVLISNEPGVYLIRFDNSASWFKERKVKYQIVNLKLIE